MSVYDIPEKVTYKGVSYTILDTLHQGLLLVVETSELENENFPTNTSVIPNQIVNNES